MFGELQTWSTMMNFTWAIIAFFIHHYCTPSFELLLFDLTHTNPINWMQGRKGINLHHLLSFFSCCSFDWCCGRSCFPLVFNDEMMTMMMGKAMPPFSCPFMPFLLLLLMMNDDHLNYNGGGNLLLMLLVVLLLHLDVCHLLTLKSREKDRGREKKGRWRKKGAM